MGKSLTVQDDTYQGVDWEPLNAGGGVLIPMPVWMQHKYACLRDERVATLPDYRGQAYHFRKFCDTFFSDPSGLFHMEWNPNAIKITDEFFSENFVSVMGARNSTKSFTLACIGAGMFLLNPKNTKVLVTSTTMDSARGKIWGDISYAWDQIEAVLKKWGIPSPGRKMSSPIIRYEVNGIVSFKAGVELIPTQNSSEQQSVDKVQGYKNDTVIFLGDEWDTLPQGLVNTVNDNLSGNPNSRCIAAFNPTGRFTSGGRLAKPKAGWDSINEDSERWEGEYGPVLRFDATKSPNIVGPFKPDGKYWNGLMTPEKLALEEIKYGSNKTAGWFTMIRGWFPATGELECIYSETELVVEYLADHKVNSWLDTPVKIMGLDPAFAHDGDHPILTLSQVGKAKINGNDLKVYEKLKSINLDLEITDKVKDKSEQVVALTKKHMEEEGVTTSNLGVDVTGAPSFGSLLNAAIGVGWLPIHSSSTPTKMPIAKSDMRHCDEVFENLMSELWGVGKALVRSGQIKGLDATTIEDMIARTQKGKGQKGDRTVVESKKVMKKRTKKSPDYADSNFICVHVARVKHGLSSAEKSKSKRPPQEKTELDLFYEANPHMMPKIKRERPRHVPLETSQAPW